MSNDNKAFEYLGKNDINFSIIFSLLNMFIRTKIDKHQKQTLKYVLDKHELFIDHILHDYLAIGWF